MAEHGNLTTGEFNRTMQSLREDIRQGFDRVTERQDIANGRTNVLEAGHSATGVRLSNLEREIFARPRAADAAGEKPRGSITVSVDPSPKVILALVMALASIIAAIAKGQGWL